MSRPGGQPVAPPAELLDAGTARLVRALAGVRGCWSPSLSPDGHAVALVSDADGDSRAYVSPVEAWAPVPVSAPGETVTAVAWSRGGAGAGWLLLSVQVSARAPAVLRAIPAPGLAATGQPLVLPGRDLDGPAGGAAFPGCWAAGRAAYAYTTVGPEASGVVLLDLETGARVLVTEGGGLLVTDVGADGRAVLRRGPRGRRHLVVVGPDGGLVRLVPRDLGGGSADGRLSPDGRTVWLRTDAGRESAALGAVPLDQEGVPGPLRVVAERDDAELETFALADSAPIAVLSWNVAGATELELLGTETGLRRPLPLLPGEPLAVASGVTLSADGGRLVAEVSGPRQPRSLVVVELPDCAPADGAGAAARPSARALSRLPGPPVDTDRLVRPALVQVEAHDGLPLPAWLYLPEGGVRRRGAGPAVVSLHGGPESQERPDFSPLHQCLAAAGIAVLAPNVRGSSGYGRTFTERDGGLRRLDAVRDVASCAAWLMAQDVGAPGQLGVHGTSYGGYLALAVLVEHRGTFAAAASVCGIADFLTFFAGTEPWIAAAALTKYGDPAVDAALLRRLSPLSKLHGASAPTLLVHGEDDTNVPVHEARQAHAALEAGGVESELVVLPGEGHSLVRPKSRLAELTSVVGWFRRHLGAGPAGPGPGAA